MKPKVVAVVGPTAVGKSSLSIEIARRFHGQVISGDSMQVYQGLDIGTAKVTEKEMQNIPHHMLDIKQPKDNFSVVDYRNYVQSFIKQITDSGYLPVLAGGSGLYIQAALFDYQFSESRRNPERTRQLEQQIQGEGPYRLHEYLQTVDPKQAEKIHPNNHKRLIRAIEIYETTGKTMTENQKQQGESPYDPVFIGLEMDREQLYKRINERVNIMMDNGLLDEVSRLYKQGLENAQAMRGIGYKEFIPYLKGEKRLEDAIAQVKQNSRRFAKRQYTWFKNKLDARWYSIQPETMKPKFQIILKDLAGILQKT